MKNVLRWILFLPAAIGAYIAAILLMNLLLFFAGGYSGDFGIPWLLNHFRDMADIIFRSVGIYFFVIVGVAVVPKRKYSIALTLSIIVWATSVVVLAGLLLLNIQTQILSLIEIPFLCGAAAIAFIQEYKKEKQRKTKQTIEYEELHDKAINSKLPTEDDASKGEALMGYSESKTVLLKDKEWSQIDGEACRVSSFMPLGSVVDTDGKVRAMDMTTPYASITIECRKLGKNITGYITHKIDFRHLWAAFKERTAREDEEVIIIWTTKNYKRFIFASPMMPKLWVWVCPKGAFEIMTDNTYKPELSGEARWNAWKPIIDWKPDVMK